MPQPLFTVIVTPMKSGSPGTSAEDYALDARFRGHDEKTRITYADFGKVLRRKRGGGR